MKKKAEGGTSMWVIALVLAIAIALVSFFLLKDSFGGAKMGIDYTTLEARIRMCAAKNNQPNIPGLELVQNFDKDKDYFPDTCDICLGTGIISDLGKDGDNSKDLDSDFYPDTCDSDMNNEKEHECTWQLCELDDENKCEKFLAQCCTPAYSIYLEGIMEESGAGATRYGCEPVNS